MNNEQKKSGGTSFLKKALRILFLVASLALLVFLLDKVGWNKIAEYSKQVGLLGILVLLILGVAESFFDSVTLKIALREKISLLYLHAANQAGAIVNRAIPWEAGEVLKVTLLRERVSSEAAISGIIVWNYLLKLTRPIAVLAAVATSCAVGYSDLPDFTPWIILASVLSFTPYIVFRVFVHIGIANTFVKLLRMVRLVRKDPEKLISKAKDIDSAVRKFSKENPSGYYRMIFFQLFARVLSWATLYFVLYFIGQQYSFAETVLIWAGLSVMGYLVGILPSRLGTTEASGWLLFELLKYDPGIGLLASCIMTLKAVIASGMAALMINFFRTPEKKRS